MACQVGRDCGEATWFNGRHHSASDAVGVVFVAAPLMSGAGVMLYLRDGQIAP